MYFIDLIDYDMNIYECNEIDKKNNNKPKTEASTNTNLDQSYLLNNLDRKWRSTNFNELND